MEMLGRYELTGQLSGQNSGYSVWGFGKKDGQDYFIKQFLSPKHPEGDTVSSPERLEKKYRQCAEFERQKVAVYQALNSFSDGNAVRVHEFFRIGPKYYIAMPKVEALHWGVGEMVGLPDFAKRRLCAIIAHGIAGLHRGGVVHADLKHDNILFTRTATGSVTAKIIDFDSSFPEASPPEAGEDIVGDLVYFSPEACCSMWGMEIPLTCKMDIFSLGVLFHQYFSGSLPLFDEAESSYAGEAVAKGLPLTLSPDLPEDVAALLEQMLSPNPLQRPNAMEVFAALSNIAVEEEPYTETAAPDAYPEYDPPASNLTFFNPGDL